MCRKMLAPQAKKSRPATSPLTFVVCQPSVRQNLRIICILYRLVPWARVEIWHYFNYNFNASLLLGDIASVYCTLLELVNVELRESTSNITCMHTLWSESFCLRHSVRNWNCRWQVLPASDGSRDSACVGKGGDYWDTSTTVSSALTSTVVQQFSISLIASKPQSE